MVNLFNDQLQIDKTAGQVFYIKQKIFKEISHSFVLFVGDRGFPGEKGSTGPAASTEGLRIKGEKGETGDRGRAGFPGLPGSKGDAGFPGRYYLQSAV